jgi:hypothetical protein
VRTRTVEWQVAGACNYDCTYCIQSRRYRRGRPDRAQLERALDRFAALPGTWEIKCSGGEAFAHPLFLDLVVPGLMDRTPHRISVLTNLSATRRELFAFVTRTRGRLSVFSASLHLEFEALDAFVARARWLADTLDPDARLVVNQVVLPGQEASAADCRDAVEAAGLRWFPQLYKVRGGVADYPDPDALAALLGTRATPTELNRAPSYKGRRCWAGVDYFTVDKDGQAWSCRTAKRHGEGRLGNVFDNTLVLQDAPKTCPWSICPCTVPANRGMIEGVGPAASVAS